MHEIIDLSQEIFTGMPVFSGLPEVEITMHVSHEQWDGISDSDVVSPAVNRLELGEHTGTHVDALNHMARQYRGQSIDTMPLTMFYTEGICLDLSHTGLLDLIEPARVAGPDRDDPNLCSPGTVFSAPYRQRLGQPHRYFGRENKGNQPLKCQSTNRGQIAD